MSSLKDPKATRDHILSVAAEAMMTQGFEGTSLSDILGEAGLSKGALYHHFQSKQELGYAVFEEVFARQFLAMWEEPLTADNPIEGLFLWIGGVINSATDEDLEQGCPMSALAMEMSCTDEGFRERALTVFNLLGERFALALRKAQIKKYVRRGVNPESTAIFIVASIQGLMLQGKYARNVEVFKSGLACLADYINSLKP